MLSLNVNEVRRRIVLLVRYRMVKDDGNTNLSMEVMRLLPRWRILRWESLATDCGTAVKELVESQTVVRD